MNTDQEQLVKNDYPMHLAGKIWIFEIVKFMRDREGELGISFAELTRIHKAVANAICSSMPPLTADEFYFLCQMTSTSSKEIAEILQCTATNVSKWKKKPHLPPLESLVLKEVFWAKIFGKDFPPAAFGSERLQGLGAKALQLKLADPVQTKQAA